MTVETVVGHNPAQIRVSREEDTEHIVHLTLVPQRTLEQTRDTRHGGGLVRVGLHPDPRVVANTKQIVDDLEPLVLGGEVNSGDIGDHGVFGRGVGFQKVHHGEQSGGRGVDDQLILPHGELLNVFGQTRHDVLSVGVQAVGFFQVLVRRVDDGGTEGSLG